MEHINITRLVIFHLTLYGLGTKRSFYLILNLKTEFSSCSFLVFLTVLKGGLFTVHKAFGSVSFTTTTTEKREEGRGRRRGQAVLRDSRFISGAALVLKS